METKTEKDMALERFVVLLASLLEKYADKVDVNCETANCQRS